MIVRVSPPRNSLGTINGISVYCDANNSDPRLSRRTARPLVDRSVYQKQIYRFRLHI